ncbi:MAG: FadR family transcriptional regulator [Burkholderiaceae bacterium]|nr:FadR family transcriptional regulator [Burkholderiaceae bacterium]
MNKRLPRPPMLWAAPVQSDTLSGRIISQVRAALFSNQIKPGEFLGSEATIAAQFNVSRMASRDALRTLEAMGIVETRKGIKGGAWIAKENPDRFADALSIQLQLIGVTADEILDSQLAIESRAAELAAVRATAQNQQDMRLALAACKAAKGDMHAFTEASIRFHELVVVASHNRILLAQFSALRFVLQPLLEPNTTEAVARKVIRSHTSLLDAIAAGDAAMAGEVMRKRISAVRSKVVSKAGAHNP